MLRSYKRKKSGEEIENVPSNPKDSVVNPYCVQGIRSPLHTIPEPTQIVLEQESGYSRSKVDRNNATPTKGGKSSGSAVRTPEKQGFSARSKFGWANKNEGSKNGADDADATHNLHQFPVSSRGSSNGIGGLLNVTPRSVRTMGRSTTNHSECSSTFSTPTKSVTKPTSSGFTASNGARPPMSIGARFGNSGALSKGIPFSSTSVVNTVQVPDFELKEDPSFWMDHNVQEMLFRVAGLPMVENCLWIQQLYFCTWPGSLALKEVERQTHCSVVCEASQAKKIKSTAKGDLQVDTRRVYDNAKKSETWMKTVWKHRSVLQQKSKKTLKLYCT